jgi:hypothetical protein
VAVARQAGKKPHKLIQQILLAQLNTCPMKYEVNFIGAKPVYLGRSLFQQGGAHLTGADPVQI